MQRKTGTLPAYDWFNTVNEIAWYARGRINMDNGGFENLKDMNPKLFYSDFYPSDGITPITHVTFSSTNGNRAAVFALSGWTGSGFTPINVTRFQP